MYQIDIDQSRNILTITTIGMLSLEEVKEVRGKIEQAHTQQKLLAGFSYITDMRQQKTVEPEVFAAMEKMNSEVHVANPPGIVIYVTDVAEGAGPKFSGAGLVKSQVDRAASLSKAAATGLVTFCSVLTIEDALCEHDNFARKGLELFNSNWQAIINRAN